MGVVGVSKFGGPHVETDHARIRELRVGLGNVEVLGADDGWAGRCGSTSLPAGAGPRSGRHRGPRWSKGIPTAEVVTSPHAPAGIAISATRTP